MSAWPCFGASRVLVFVAVSLVFIDASALKLSSTSPQVSLLSNAHAKLQDAATERHDTYKDSMIAYGPSVTNNTTSLEHRVLNASGAEWFRAHTDERGVLVLMFVDSSYEPVWKNWVSYSRFKATLPQRVAVVCTGSWANEETSRDCYRLSQNNTSAAGRLNDLWRLRALLLSDLLTLGHNVLMTDADAMWVQDPIPTMLDIDADIVASRGSYPSDVALSWGATACMGLIFFRATDAVRVVVENMLAYSSNEQGFDDQATLNHVLFNMHVRFPTHLTYMESKEVDVGTSEKPGQTVVVALLPHSKFMRHCPAAIPSGVMVAHCLSSKTPEDKLSGLKAHSLKADTTL